MEDVVFFCFFFWFRGVMMFFVRIRCLIIYGVVISWGVVCRYIGIGVVIGVYGWVWSRWGRVVDLWLLVFLLVVSVIIGWSVG